MVDNAVFRLSISSSLPVIFAIEVRKCAPNFGHFLPFHIPWGAVPQSCIHIIIPVRHVEKFGDVAYPGPKVITANRPNCKPFLNVHC